MPKDQVKYACRECGYETPRWLGRCPECSGWGTLDEARVRAGRGRAGLGAQGRGGAAGEPAPTALPVTDLPAGGGSRQPTGLGELDLVLGGGIVAGSCVLIAGDPGVGKSTLLMGVAAGLARQGQAVLYVTGEESAAQVRLRAERVGALDPRLLVLADTDVLAAVAAAQRIRPAVMMVDSIQTMYHPEVASPPGSVPQVRECASALLDLAKGLGCSVWLVGHVTKEGVVAGPRTLEHMVDVVLQFEGDRSYPHRILRGHKNRFGATDEIGIFEMGESGLAEVSNPSQLFLGDGAAGPGPARAPGTAVAAAMEGRRVILAEVQALVVPSPWGAPRRTAMGVDTGRLALIIAVLERRAGLKLGDRDVYVKVAGGVRLTEPGVDLAVAVAVSSAQLNRAVKSGLAFAGEIGLAGEVRTAARLEARLREANKLGFSGLVARPPAGPGGATGAAAGAATALPGMPGLCPAGNIGLALAAGLEPPRLNQVERSEG